MDTAQALQRVQQSLVELLALPCFVKDSDQFTRWRVQTNVALRMLLDPTSPEFKQFCFLAYMSDAAGTEALTPAQRAADWQSLITLLETVGTNLSLASVAACP